MKYRVTDKRSKESWIISTRKQRWDRIIEDTIKQIRWTDYHHMSELEIKDNLRTGHRNGTVIIEEL